MLDFLGQFVNFLGRGAKYINLRARIKILFVNTHTSIFFSKVECFLENGKVGKKKGYTQKEKGWNWKKEYIDEKVMVLPRVLLVVIF